jgi:hypothetical protein
MKLLIVHGNSSLACMYMRIHIHYHHFQNFTKVVESLKIHVYHLDNLLRP